MRSLILELQDIGNLLGMQRSGNTRGKASSKDKPGSFESPRRRYSSVPPDTLWGLQVEVRQPPPAYLDINSHRAVYGRFCRASKVDTIEVG